MRVFIFTALIVFAAQSFGQEAVVDVTLHPAGSFKAKTSEVKGFAKRSGDKVEAKDIKVDLKNLKTQIALRDTHTKKYLEVEKYPEAILVSATGSAGKGSGRIRIKGIEKKIEGTYEIKGKNLSANFSLKLSDFKITGIKYMGVGVDDKVVVHVTVPLN